MLRLIPALAAVACLSSLFAAADPEPAGPLLIPLESGLWEGELKAPSADYGASGTFSECLAGEPAGTSIESLILSRIDPEGRCEISDQQSITDHFIMTQIKCTEGAFTYGEIVTNGDATRLNVYADLSFGAEETAKPSGVVQISLAHAGACPAE